MTLAWYHTTPIEMVGRFTWTSFVYVEDNIETAMWSSPKCEINYSCICTEEVLCGTVSSNYSYVYIEDSYVYKKDSVETAMWNSFKYHTNYSYVYNEDSYVYNKDCRNF